MICTKCKLDKELIYFRERKDAKTGYQYWCRECESNGSKKRYKPKPRIARKKIDKEQVKLSALKRMLLHRYNLTYESYFNMYKVQDGRCKICNTEKELGGRKGLQVDHCHKTGQVRHLLCPSCNSGIAFIDNFKDVGLIMKYLANVHVSHNNINNER